MRLQDVHLNHRSKESIIRTENSRVLNSKETAVDIGILITSRYGDRKIMQSIRVMGKPPMSLRK